MTKADESYPLNYTATQTRPGLRWQSIPTNHWQIYSLLGAYLKSSFFGCVNLKEMSFQCGSYFYFELDIFVIVRYPFTH